MSKSVVTWSVGAYGSEGEPVATMRTEHGEEVPEVGEVVILDHQDGTWVLCILTEKVGETKELKAKRGKVTEVRVNPSEPATREPDPENKEQPTRDDDPEPINLYIHLYRDDEIDCNTIARALMESGVVIDDDE